MVIYLNNDFEGGATSFLSEGGSLHVYIDEFIKKNPLHVGDVVCSVSPRAGTALIFNHDTLHEGEQVTWHTKYIIRTEVMFKRVDTEMLPNPLSYTENENYLKTVTLYMKSYKLEQGTVESNTVFCC